jgi:predicted RNA-binding Zn ribbon-like protein
MLPILNIGLNTDLKSGHPILEFTNTVGNHASDHPGEHLFGYGDLLAWMGNIGLLQEEQVQVLKRKAAAQSEKSTSAFARSLELRESIYRIFVAQTKGESPAQDDLEVLNSVLRNLTGGAQIGQESGKFAWQWNFDATSLEAPLSIIALAAADLMTSENIKWVGQCADEDGCGWLFVDTSKNHSRRWCDINDCGNRAKQRRYLQRARRQKP